MTLRLTEELEQQIKAVIQTTGTSKHQFIIDAIKDSLSGKVYQSLDAAQQVKEQLEGNRPITEAALDIKNALDMLQAQIHKLSEENRAIKEELTKKKDEPEHQFKPGYEVTKQSTVRFSILVASKYIEQYWSKDGGKQKDKYRYHPELGIITREGKTKTGRMSFWIIATDLEDLTLSPEGYFISPLGTTYGYNQETWAIEEEEVKANGGRGKDPYKYRVSEDEEFIEDFDPGITPEHLHETFGIDHKDLVTRRILDICIEGVWTHFIKDSNNMWSKTGYYQAIDYASKAKVTN
ncbi:hypothetical protein [Nostoc sp. ChiVER01]|uniref:hypothetical protein n=1 Tax=Nostoc sp. ChiVER01 TaxID=3075382 RepID=UPI002AD33A7D|nr:hypothetical protein [Nostoc sp. ChiVER01]MDZ8221851.1 hypothetical protein [Nostoc sp. ChiVER01]